MGTLDGKVAIVTGGAGALGAAVVTAFLDAGAAVAVSLRAAGDLDQLRERSGIPAEAKLSGAALDLADEKAVPQYLAPVAAQPRGLALLVNIPRGFGGGPPAHATTSAPLTGQP